MEKTEHFEKSDSNPNAIDDNFTVVTKRNKRRSKLLNSAVETGPNLNDFSGIDSNPRHSSRDKTVDTSKNRSYFLMLAPASNKKVPKENLSKHRAPYSDGKDLKKSKLPKLCRKNFKPGVNVQTSGETSEAKSGTKEASRLKDDKQFVNSLPLPCSKTATSIISTEARKETSKRQKCGKLKHIEPSIRPKDENITEGSYKDDVREENHSAKNNSSKKRKLTKNCQKQSQGACPLSGADGTVGHSSLPVIVSHVEKLDECSHSETNPLKHDAAPTCNRFDKSKRSSNVTDESILKSKLPRKLSGKNSENSKRDLSSKPDYARKIGTETQPIETEGLYSLHSPPSVSDCCTGSLIPGSQCNDDVTNDRQKRVEIEACDVRRGKDNLKGSSSIPVFKKSKNGSSKIAPETNTVKTEGPLKGKHKSKNVDPLKPKEVAAILEPELTERNLSAKPVEGSSRVPPEVDNLSNVESAITELDTIFPLKICKSKSSRNCHAELNMETYDTGALDKVLEPKIPLRRNQPCDLKDTPDSGKDDLRKEDLKPDIEECQISPVPDESEKLIAVENIKPSALTPHPNESSQVLTSVPEMGKSGCMQGKRMSEAKEDGSNAPGTKDKKQKRSEKNKQLTQKFSENEAMEGNVETVSDSFPHTSKKLKKADKVKSELLRAEDIDEIVQESFNGGEDDDTSVDDNLKAFLNIQLNLTKTGGAEETFLSKNNLNDLSSATKSDPDSPYAASVFNNIKYIDDESGECNYGLSRNSIISRLRHEFFNSNNLSTPTICGKPSIIKSNNHVQSFRDAEPKKNVTFCNSEEMSSVAGGSSAWRGCRNGGEETKTMYNIAGELIFEHRPLPKFPSSVVNSGPFHSRQSYDPYLEVINEEGGEMNEISTEINKGHSQQVMKKHGDPGTQATHYCKVNVFHAKPVEHVEIVDVGNTSTRTGEESRFLKELETDCKNEPSENLVVDIVQTTSLSNVEAVCVTIDSDSDVMTASSIADDDPPPPLPLASPVLPNATAEPNPCSSLPILTSLGPRMFEKDELETSSEYVFYGSPDHEGPHYENVGCSLVCMNHNTVPQEGLKQENKVNNLDCLSPNDLSDEPILGQIGTTCSQTSHCIEHVYENVSISSAVSEHPGEKEALERIKEDDRFEDTIGAPSGQNPPLKNTVTSEGSPQTTSALCSTVVNKPSSNGRGLPLETYSFPKELSTTLQQEEERPTSPMISNSSNIITAGSSTISNGASACNFKKGTLQTDATVMQSQCVVGTTSTDRNNEDEHLHKSCSSDESESSLELDCFDSYSFHCAERLEQLKDSIVYDFSSDEIEDTKKTSDVDEKSDFDLPSTGDAAESVNTTKQCEVNVLGVISAEEHSKTHGTCPIRAVDRAETSESGSSNGFKSQLIIAPSVVPKVSNDRVTTELFINKILVDHGCLDSSNYTINTGNDLEQCIGIPANNIDENNEEAAENASERCSILESFADSPKSETGTELQLQEGSIAEPLPVVAESDVDFDYFISENSALTTIRRDSTKNVVKLESAEEIVCSESASSFASASFIPHLRRNSQENLSKSDVYDSRQESSSSNSTTLSTVRHNSSDSVFVVDNSDLRPDRSSEIPSLKELCLITVLSLPNSLNILENIGLSDLLFENGFNDDCDNADLEMGNEMEDLGEEWRSQPELAPVERGEASSSSESQLSELPPPPPELRSQGCNSFVPYRSFGSVQMTSVGTNTEEPDSRDQPFHDDSSLRVIHSDCEWIGLPIDTHSTILLSPSQYSTYKFSLSPEQNANLLDLHNKFSARRGYHELDWKSLAHKSWMGSYELSSGGAASHVRPMDPSLVSVDSNSTSASRIVDDGNTAVAAMATINGTRNAGGGRVHRLLGDRREPGLGPGPGDSSMPAESLSTIHQGAPKPSVSRSSNWGSNPRKQTNIFHLGDNTNGSRNTASGGRGRQAAVFRGEEIVGARKSSLEVSSNIEPGYSRLLAIVQENANECHSKSALDSTPGCLVRKPASNSNGFSESVDFKSCACKSSEVENCESPFGGQAPPVAPSRLEDHDRCLVQPENMPEQKLDSATPNVGGIRNTFKAAALNVNKYNDIFTKNGAIFGKFDDNKFVCENVVINYDDNSCTEHTVKEEKTEFGDSRNRNGVDPVNCAQNLNSFDIPAERGGPLQQRVQILDCAEQIQKSIEESRHFFENLSKIKQSSWSNHRRSSLPNVNELQGENRLKISKRGDFLEISKSQTLFDNKSNQNPRKYSLETKSLSGENFRQDMYNEYMRKLAERSERRSNKVIKVSQPQAVVSSSNSIENGSNWSDSKNDLGYEFIKKVRQRMEKYGLDIDNSDDPSLVAQKVPVTSDSFQNDANTPPKKLSNNLPKHIQEFLQLSGCQSTVTQHTDIETDLRRSLSLYQEVDDALRGFLSGKGVWSPAVTPEAQRKVYEDRTDLKKTEKDGKNGKTEPIPPVWTPKSGGRATPSDQIAFKPVVFQSPLLSRKAPKQAKEAGELQSKLPVPVNGAEKKAEEVIGPSVKERISAFSPVSGKKGEEKKHTNHDQSKLQSLNHSQSGQCGLALPKSQNPTITLLQKAREGQLTKGALYLDDQKMYTKEIPEKTKSPETEKNPESKVQVKKVMDQEHKPTEKIKSLNADGTSSQVILEGRDENQQKWYKRMYESLHQANLDKSNVTVRYWPNQPVDRASQKIRNGNSGYSSEPETTINNSDKISAKYATLDRRRNQSKENNASLSYVPRTKPSNEALRHAVEVYNSQPGRIENYEPGRCSIADKETKEWWDEMMEIFDKQYGETGGHRHQSNQPSPQKKHFMTYTLKDGGYESDSSLVFKRRDENCDMSPTEKKLAYKEIQKGGEVPLHGLRKPAPQRPKDDSVIEYFPISAHLTKIRVHRSRRSQPVEPLREIICYPVTSIEHSNIQPVFSQFKRSAPPASIPVKKSPEPPSPPKRRSSRKNSMLQLVSKISVVPDKSKPKLVRSSSGIEVDSNVEYLKERLQHKLGVAKESQKKSASSEFSKRQKIMSSCLNFSRSLPSRQKSISPGAKRMVNKPVAKSTSLPDSPLSKPTHSSLRSRKEQQEASSKKLYASLDLKSPAEVSKVLNRNYISDQRERAIRNSKKFPPGTVVRSSTTYYNSSNPSKLNQDKALKVTVAISAKGRELLKPTHVSSIQSKSELKSSCPKRTLSNIILSSRGASAAKNVCEKSKTSTKNSERKRLVVNKDFGKISSSQSPPTSNSPDRAWCTPAAATKIKVEKCESPESPAKKRFKGKVELSKQQSTGEATVEKKPYMKPSADKSCSNKSPKNGKKRGRKPKSDTDSQVEESISKKIENASNSPIHSVDIKITKTRVPDVSNKPAVPSDLSNVTKSPSLQRESLQNSTSHLATSPTPSIVGSIYRSPSVLERTRSLYKEDGKTNYKSEPSLRLLNIYLAHKKPVSESRFKSLDQDFRSKISSRSLSPSYSFRRAEFLDKIDKFDVDNVWSSAGSRTYLRHTSPPVLKGRSSSEPPMSSPSDDNDSNAPSPFCCGLKSALLSSDRISSPHSRSPSTRRIQSAKSSIRCSDVESETHSRKARARSAQKSTPQEKLLRNNKSLSSSSLSQFNDYNDYQAYVFELMHSTKKSERFKELHKFYKNLERLGELEQTASSSDLRPRLKNEEIIDFDRWKSLRKKEKAEEELKDLYRRLKEDQREKDLVFEPKDVDSFRWRVDKDRGLKSREKSVEDIKQQFYRMDRERSISKSGSFSMGMDTYKPLWRGSSVVDLASSLACTTSSHHGRPVSQVERSASTIPRPSSLKYGKYIGSRLWSSLSMDQVNALKSQLNEIYSTVSSLKRERINKMLQSRAKKSQENFEIEVTAVARPTETSPQPKDSALHVRCNSLLTRDQTYSPLVRKKETKRNECMKANSIGSIPSWKCSNEKQFLSETDKKKISMKLSHEVLDRVTKKNSLKKKRHSGSLVIPRETMGAVASIKSFKKVPSAACSISSVSSPRTCYSMEISDLESQHCSATDEHQNNYMLVLKPSHEEECCKESKKQLETYAATNPTHTTSNSETESGSSDASTVIHLGIRESVEKSKIKSHDNSNILRAYLNDQDPVESNAHLESNSSTSRNEKTKEMKNLCPSQSFADFKEIFGERQMYQNLLSRSPVLSIASLTDTARPKSLPIVSSEESVFRSRSTTPDPMKYYRAYLNMVKSGDVRKLRDRFESLEELHSLCSASWVPLKRFQSDPELTRIMLSQSDKCRSPSVKDCESGDVQFLRSKYERITSPRRQRTRYRPISPKSLIRNRYMPHINVISKSASLQSQRVPATASRAQRVSEVKLPYGAVERIRRMFELKQSLSDVSLVGQMYTSAPNIRELSDIAPYLECQWIAHQHPDPTYHSRSLSSPDTDSKRSPMYSLKPRPQSASPTRKRQSSILKQAKDVFAQQKFDPAIHQPTYRYQPPTPGFSPHLSNRLRYWRNDPHFWCKYFHSKPTVTFKEPVLREVSHSSSLSPFYSNQPQTESPAGRYAESAVTLQYRRPVLAEVKEALSEDELARRQAEAMQRLYQEERRRKYLQELHDISSRRHTDHFIPSQKSPIPLNRYDDFFPDESPIISRQRDRTPEPKLVARALYNFVGQSSRELSFRRGDIIFVRRQIDKNWYEGEHNAMIGLFPFNYVEIIPYDNIRTTPKKPTEGQARAKFNFVAQSHLELSLVKGELVVLTRRVDSNWFEGRIGNRRGIFPVSYVEVLVEPGERAFSPVRPTTPATPVTHSSLSNGSSQPIPLHSLSDESSDRVDGKQDMSLVSQTLHIDTQSDPIPYRALYNYRPQNEDELELQEGDTVYVIEKCDDGWYVGSSQRTGAFGTFPGNYVQRAA